MVVGRIVRLGMRAELRARLGGMAALEAVCRLMAAAERRPDGDDRVAVGPRAAMDRSAYRFERLCLSTPFARRRVPALGGDYQVFGRSTIRYNCISYSLGIRDRWISPVTGPGRLPFLWADRVYGRLGYRRLPAADLRPSPGSEKVAVYAILGGDGRVARLTHAAVQLPDGSWASKVGPFALIRHRTPAAMEGPSHGRVVAVYARPAAPGRPAGPAAPVAARPGAV